ncbi:glucuronate isomerase [Acutalibacter intestini]|uniref:glucuronate isomerase n=1 Tax=Acutalibacter intestini TaxID=3093659 RepID=UPI002AC8ABB7|nr:glucuronate isomerase [Acutalibacter sp. M00204]
MKSFMDRDFLLSTPAAQELYQSYAETMPIVDYHCHIDPKEIAQDRRFENISQVWLGGDHYKWRQMRWAGVEEEFITGNAPDREKFQKWAETMDKAVGNPLFHWSHLELRRFFGYEGVLTAKSAGEVWDFCNAKLQEPDMSARNLILRSNVKLLCTTDDPADDLCWHKQLSQDQGFPVQVLPAWRPDKAMNLEKPDYLDYLRRLGDAADIEINSFSTLKAALKKRMSFFASMGCRLSDHGLESGVFAPCDEAAVEAVFARRLGGEAIGKTEQEQFKTAFLLFAASEYARLGWAMQLHYGCHRDSNAAMFQKIGPDTGFDCIHDQTATMKLAALLDQLNSQGHLPKTVLYSLNPADDPVLDAMIGCFQSAGAGCMGKVQHGSAWWFNDHRAGMTRQLTSLANLGLLGSFIGMLTDSRSFLSYPRHEYFRRILCQLLGGWVENGECPWDPEWLGQLVKDISYNNAVQYFGFELETI